MQTEETVLHLETMCVRKDAHFETGLCLRFLCIVLFTLEVSTLELTLSFIVNSKCRYQVLHNLCAN